MPDPDYVDDVLSALTVHTGTSFDAIWQHLMVLDPEEIEEHRELMKMHLARYAKQDLHKWDNVEVAELRRWHHILSDVLANENSITSATED